MQAVLPKSGGARPYAYAADLELINKEKLSVLELLLRPESFLPSLTCFLSSREARHTNLLPVDQTLKDGETLPMANDIEVIHSPGHCAGHIALLLRQEGVYTSLRCLFAGDGIHNSQAA